MIVNLGYGKMYREPDLEAMARGLKYPGMDEHLIAFIKEANDKHEPVSLMNLMDEVVRWCAERKKDEPTIAVVRGYNQVYPLLSIFALDPDCFPLFPGSWAATSTQLAVAPSSAKSCPRTTPRRLTSGSSLCVSSCSATSAFLPHWSTWTRHHVTLTWHQTGYAGSLIDFVAQCLPIHFFTSFAVHYQNRLQGSPASD